MYFSHDEEIPDEGILCWRFVVETAGAAMVDAAVALAEIDAAAVALEEIGAAAAAAAVLVEVLAKALLDLHQVGDHRRASRQCPQQSRWE